MKILFDQNTPAKLRHHLPKHVIETAAELGWQELKNGDLLRVAEASGFDLLVSADQNMQYQNSLVGFRIAVLALSTNNWPVMRLHVARVAEAIDRIQSGTFKRVECGQFVARKLRDDIAPGT